MLDLSKPMGLHEGISFYGDHEHDNTVYYLPNRVGLVPIEPEIPDIGKTYDFFLQIFKEGTAVRGGLEELKESSGAIMSLGVQCTVDSEKLEKLRSKLVDDHGLPADFFYTTPDWHDGTIDLIVLDAATGDGTTLDDDSFVDSIIGSRKPTLSGDLEAVFNVRLDRKGAGLVAATLLGDRSSLAGVLYDLKFKAIRPALDLKIEADLDRCYDKVEHLVSVGASVTYGGITLSAEAEFEFIKEKLIEDGDIKVELLSLVTDTETKKLVDKMVKEFTDNVMRELFRPMVNSDIDIDLSSMVSLPEITVAYKFQHKKSFHNKKIAVDYRQRSATIKTHNPQAHLWLIGQQIKDRLDLYTHTVTFSDLWRENELEVKVLHDFEDEGNDLLSAEVLIWRKKDGKVSEMGDRGFAIPDDALPLASFTVTKDDKEEHKIAWITEKDEPAGYFYQAKFIYGGHIPNLSTPPEVFTEVVFSSSQDLIIIPQVLAPLRVYEFKYGNIDASKISGVDIFIRSRDAEGNQLEQEILSLSDRNGTEQWKIRSNPFSRSYEEEERHFHFTDGRPTLKAPPVALVDGELIVSDPFAFKSVDLIPIITGVQTKEFAEVLLRLTYSNTEADYEFDRLFRAKAPDFLLPEITIPVLTKGDTVDYRFRAITNDGDLIDLEEGKTTGGSLILQVREAPGNDPISILWKGPAPEDEDLDYLRLEFKLQTADGEERKLEKVEFSGDEPPEPVHYVYEGEGTLFMREVRRYVSGEKEKERYKSVQTKEIIIRP